MQISNSSNPATVVKRWQADRRQTQSQEAKSAVDYEKAVERFQDDFALVSSFDGTALDKNQEPGEVDIGGRGYLRSTEDGFEMERGLARYPRPTLVVATTEHLTNTPITRRMARLP